MRHHYYVLSGPVPVPVKRWEWARNFANTESRRVARTEINGAQISTVFLGIDHQFGSGPPLLFETMIFGGEHDDWQARCSTWQEAEAQHEEACRLVRKEA